MKLLYVTSLSGKRINGFMRSAIVAAREQNIEFTMACNMEMADAEGYAQDCRDYGIKAVHIDFDRNPLSPKNRLAYRQLLELMKAEGFDLVHCNTPIGGVLGRLCAKKAGIPTVIYMAHGFHFWKGAPLKNWLLYYPVEWLMARDTDILITITKDDYALAKRLPAKAVRYVHGVGVDFNRFSAGASSDRNLALRQQLGIPENAPVLLSVGELNSNKNHGAVIKAVESLEKDDLYYVICGEGELRESYRREIARAGLSHRIILAGFCQNIREYYQMADYFVFPSLREGVPAAVMEAAASGLPVIASDIRGIRDVISEGNYRFDPRKEDEIAEKIKLLLNSKHTASVERNYANLQPYAFDAVVAELAEIYKALV